MPPNKTVKHIPPSPYQTTEIISEGKKEKQGGKEYILYNVWPVPGFIKPLEPGSMFIECNDGWYIVYNERKERMCYRVGSKTVEEVFGTESINAI